MLERVSGAVRGVPAAWSVACVLAGRAAGFARRGCGGIVIVRCAAEERVARSAARMVVGRNIVSSLRMDIVQKVNCSSRSRSPDADVM